MPQPQQVDDAAQTLLELYRQAQASIDAQLAAIANDPPARVAALTRRLTELQQSLRADVADLNAATRDWIQQDLPLVWQLGGQIAAADIGVTFAWTQVHQAGLQVLAAQTYTDIAASLRAISAMSRDFIRSKTKLQTAHAMLLGQTPQVAGRSLADTLGADFASVTYANGARYSIGDYTAMLLRTTTGNAYNRGTILTSGENGVEWMECFDSPDCGLDGHDDDVKPDGQVWPIDTADEFPLSHPNCVRAWGPRPDVTSTASAAGAEPTVEPGQAQAVLDARAANVLTTDERVRPAAARHAQVAAAHAARVGA